LGESGVRSRESGVGSRESEATLENQTCFSVPASDVFAVEKFEQGDGVLARDTGPVFELRDAEAAAFV
jgi:hypothetical protein